MELFGFRIRMDRVEMMLRYCTMLEVCHLVHVLPYSDEEDIYDSEEPTSVEISCVKGTYTVSDKTKGRPSRLFDASARREFKKAKTNASWPTSSLEPPYVLPSLHSFHIDMFNSRISQLNMPTLRHLGLYGKGLKEKEEDILSSTCSSFPGTLTHLSFGGYAVPLELILNAFPYTTELSFHYFWEESALSTVKNLHTSLTVIKYVCHGSSENMTYHVGDLLSVMESGMLPVLREVTIVRWEGKYGRKDEELPIEKFRMLGVASGVRFVKPFGQYLVVGELRLPDYLYYQ
jgi:hypothetical protein